MAFTSCKKEKTKGNESPSSITNQPNEKEEYFTFKKDGVFYEMDAVMLGSSSKGFLGGVDLGSNNYCAGITTGSLPRIVVDVMFSDTLSQSLGEFEIGLSNGVGISYLLEEEDPNSSFNKKTYYDYNQRGTIRLEKTITGITTKGTFEFVGYNASGTDSIIVTDGKFKW